MAEAFGLVAVVFATGFCGCFAAGCDPSDAAVLGAFGLAGAGLSAPFGEVASSGGGLLASEAGLKVLQGSVPAAGRGLAAGLLDDFAGVPSVALLAGFG